MRRRLLALPLAALAFAAAPSSAQDAVPQDEVAQQDAQSSGEARGNGEETGDGIGWAHEPIIVQGIREEEERVEVMTKAITRRPRVDKPIAKFFQQACFGVFGMQADYATVIIDQMKAHARRLDIPVGGDGCQVNVLVGFVTDGREEVKALRKSEPKMFDSLLDYEFDRIMRGNGAVQAWHGTQVNSSDGREFSAGGGGASGPKFAINSTYRASRLRDEIRTDMTGAIILIDKTRTPGKTLQQLADYASMRAFVPVDDMTGQDGSGIETILSLFNEDATPPAGLTRFDKAYMEAIYRLPATATGPQIHDATWSIYRGEAGEEDDG